MSRVPCAKIFLFKSRFLLHSPQPPPSCPHVHIWSLPASLPPCGQTAEPLSSHHAQSGQAQIRLLHLESGLTLRDRGQGNPLKLQDIAGIVSCLPRECVAPSRFSIGYHFLFPQRKTNSTWIWGETSLNLFVGHDYQDRTQVSEFRVQKLQFADSTKQVG